MRRFFLEAIRVSPLLILTIGFYGCTVPHSVVEFESREMIDIPTKVGYSQFSMEEKNEERGKGSIRAFDSTMATILYKNQIESFKVNIHGFEKFSDVEIDEIVRLCDKHGLDGIFLTQLNLEAVHRSTFAVMQTFTGTRMVCSVDMKYLNREGELVMLSHSNYRSSAAFGENVDYRATPTVATATSTALNEILKTFGLNPED